MRQEKLISSILKSVEQYYEETHGRKRIFPGKDHIPVTVKTFDSEELKNLVLASLEFWLTTGSHNTKFQKQLSQQFNLKYCLTVNSGSSANLLALSALTSPQLGDRRLVDGDEVITAAAGFPTTINPILQNNLVPVFVDVEIPSYNIDPRSIEGAITEKTKAISIAHTLGNPFDLASIRKICDKHNLFLLEDCADALGAEFDGQHVGTFGDTATLSFYPAHHITTGEGGAVLTKNSKLKVIIESLRDWGRDCYCEPGVENTCKKRFCWKLGKLPFGYDHKYTYSHVGYNLKMTDLQAAIGVVQMQKLQGFVKKRRQNFNTMVSAFSALSEHLILPQSHELANPSWFGFPLSVRNGSHETKTKLLQKYEEKGIGVRLLFAGNVVKQPYMQDQHFRIAGNLKNSDFVMNSTFWLGLHPQIQDEHIEYMLDVTTEFFQQRN